MNYTTLAEMTAARGRKKLANNTYVEKRDDGRIAIRLHDTDIMTFDPSGEIEVQTGGWKTVTTKARLNDYLPVSIYQECGQWYWNTGNGKLPFSDGDKVSAQGKVLAQSKDNSEDKKLQKQILAYAKLYKAPLEAPGAGDCFYCAMSTQDGKSLGDCTENKDHLMSHIEESYVVPSLAYRALKEAGNSDMVISAAFNTEDMGFVRDIVNERLPKAVAKYVRRRLGLVG